jgi:DNA-binding transcriptional ArsR family regulator
VSRLADIYPMSFAAVQKHVSVLERAGLVTKERRRRELVRSDPDAVGRARRILEELEAAWRAAMPTLRVQAQPTEGNDGTRMELRFNFESREHMELLEPWGAFEVFPQSVGQMDALLATDTRTDNPVQEVR